MKNPHLGHCVIAVALAVVLLIALGVEAGTLGVLAVALACPLMMLLMMRSMTGGQSSSSAHDDHPVDQGQRR